MHTDEGLTGWASGDALPDREQLESFLVGLDPFRTELVRELEETVDFHGGRPWTVEAAVWDVLGKATGQPVWKLLGGRSERLLAYASSGELVAPRERAARCVALRDAGIRAVKIRFHHADWREDVAVVKAVRDAVGTDLELMVDANQGWRMPGDLEPRWDVATAAQVARALEPLGVYWLEEPLRTDDLEGYRALRGLTSLRLAAGEMVRSAQEARDLVLRGGIDVLQCDVVLSLGIGGCRRAAALADLLGRAWSPHTWSNGYGLLVNLHAALALLDGAVHRGAIRPAGLVARAARLAAAGPDRDCRRRHDRTAGGPGSRRRARSRDARALEDRVMRMRAAVLHEPGEPLVVEEVELDPPKAGEVLVKVAAAACVTPTSISPTERWAEVAGRWSWATRVQESSRPSARASRASRSGEPIGFSFVPSCRACTACRAGRFNLCAPAGRNGRRGTLMDGTSRLRLPDGTTLQHGLMTACFAEYTVVDARGVVPIPPELPLWQAALLGCGVMTGFGAVKKRRSRRTGESVAVIGCGGVGLQVVAAAASPARRRSSPSTVTRPSSRSRGAAARRT